MANVAAPRGKGSWEELLPSRHALSGLVEGDQVQRSLGNYAKKTPLTVASPAPTIMTVGKQPK